MPSLICHDCFGRALYADLKSHIGDKDDDYDIFLLGNIGPDPLFYSVISQYRREPAVQGLGTRMHHEQVPQMLEAFWDEAHSAAMEPKVARLARAYVLGLFAHYQLDSVTHPFIFAQQYESFDAGELDADEQPKLTRDSTEAHAIVETELDEMVLWTTRSLVVGQLKPHKDLLRGTHEQLEIIGRMYKNVIKRVYDLSIPADTFEECVLAMRAAQHALYSPRGIKRAIISRIERAWRGVSLYSALSHRKQYLRESVFDNRRRDEWVNPFTGEQSGQRFWDEYERAAGRARVWIRDLTAHEGGNQNAATIHGGLFGRIEHDFDGRPLEDLG